MSNINVYKGVLKPRVFHVSRYDLICTRNLIRNWIEKFAKVKEIEEICTNSENRSFRTYKVTIEHIYYKEFMTSSN